jgi:hypothetical protein
MPAFAPGVLHHHQQHVHKMDNDTAGSRTGAVKSMRINLREQMSTMRMGRSPDRLRCMP